MAKTDLRVSMVFFEEIVGHDMQSYQGQSLAQSEINHCGCGNRHGDSNMAPNIAQCYKIATVF